MELKTARLTLLIDPAKKEAFERLCAQQDLTPSQVVRQMIRAYLAEHGVSYAPSGSASRPAAARAPTFPAADEAPSQTVPRAGDETRSSRRASTAASGKRRDR